MIFNKEPFETDYVKMWIEQGIMHTTYPPGTVITLDIAKKIVEDRLVYCEGKMYPGLADIRNMKKAEYAAMKFWSSKESYGCISALAVHSDSRIGKTFFNFWFKVDKPYKPTKYFNDKETAYLFLKPFTHLS